MVEFISLNGRESKESGLFSIRLASKLCAQPCSWISEKREAWKILARSLHCEWDALLMLERKVSRRNSIQLKLI